VKIEKTTWLAIAVASLTVALVFAETSLAVVGLRPTGELKANPATEVVTLLENPRESSSLRLNADYFVRPYLSIGEATPIMPDPTRSWQTFQTKVWLPLPASHSETKFFLQSGLGSLQADSPLASQSPWAMSSFLVPFGVGVDSPLEFGHGVTTMFSLNVSDIRTGSQSSTHLTPGLVFGFRF
jgi:hypothetical protein